ncbi:MAG TPA: cupin domain-containing protein [Rhizobiaceae bacterium]|nr:cupin domain-containing protein [Rhizobiaceae bacterium]
MPRNVIDWDKLETTEAIPGFFGKVCHSDSMTFVLWDIKKGAKLPEHNHVHEQVAHVLSGEFEITVDGETRRMKAGMLGNVPSNARHSGVAITDCQILDVFHPIREDYLNGLSATVISGTKA